MVLINSNLSEMLYSKMCLGKYLITIAESRNGAALQPVFFCHQYLNHKVLYRFS